MVNTADAVVIGGGINGTNIAWWLARRKAGKVFLLEKNAIASGASGKSGALIGSHFGTEIKVRLALKAMETWKNFNDVYGVKGEYYDRCGRVWLVPKEDADAMRGIVEMQRGFGSDARILTKEELREHAPQVFLDDVAGIVHEPSAGFADALGATSAVAQSARDAGVEIRLGVAARAINVAGGKVTGVETTTGAISAPMVFNAAYLGAAPLLEPLGVKIPGTRGACGDRTVSAAARLRPTAANDRRLRAGKLHARSSGRDHVRGRDGPLKGRDRPRCRQLSRDRRLVHGADLSRARASSLPRNAPLGVPRWLLGPV
jgi:glycine/D-amino acid oxidase-like deaminating enzyme